MKIKVGINGMGRIGRMIVRSIIENNINNIEGFKNCQKVMLNFGINEYGKSAPYKKIYDFFGLNSESIVKKIKEKL